MRILVLKTAALGDVLRTTSILPGLHAAHPGCEVVWVTAPAALELVRHHPLVARTIAVDAKDAEAVARLGDELGGERWERVLSFDDEEPLCRLASRLGRPGEPGVLSGAYLDDGAGERRYTPDVAPWFDMGLLSVHGKAAADRLKKENRESHATLFARMLGIEMGEPELPLPPEALAFAEDFAARAGIAGARPLVGLNTGAGGRWESKKLSVERTAELARLLAHGLGEEAAFLLLGGPEERERNDALLRAVGGDARMVDGGTENPIPAFAALVDRLDVLVTSDSLALHVAVARRVPVVAFFAPTPAAEIELYGRGAKVESTSADYASYRSDADTSSLTPERIAAAVFEVLGTRRPR